MLTRYQEEHYKRLREEYVMFLGAALKGVPLGPRTLTKTKELERGIQYYQDREKEAW